MPGLIWLGRRWNVNSDDFVIQGFLAGSAHATWFAVALVMYLTCFTDTKSSCPDYADRQSYSLSLLVVHASSIIAFGVLSYISSRGRVFEMSKRVHVGTCLSVLGGLVMIQFGLSVWGAIISSGTAHSCSTCTSSTINALMIASWVLCILPALAIATSFDPSGAKHQHGWTNDEEQEAYEALWFTRCRWMCCCVSSRPKQGTHEHEVFTSISKTMSAVFQNLDLTPSDIAAGMVLLNVQQREKRNRLAVLASPKSTTKQVPLLTPVVSSVDLQHLEDLESHQAYYLGAYGSLVFLWAHVCSGPLRLLCLARCCNPYRFKSIGEGRFRFDSTALLAFTGLSEDDILFANFGNQVCLPGFYVAVPRNTAHQDEIIIGVRGTLSLQDAITDAFSFPEPYKVSDVDGECFVHVGMLRCCHNIIKLLEEHGILAKIRDDPALNTKKIVVLGHSLGAGVASILTIVLREEHAYLKERLRCLAYSPPGGLLSRNLAHHTESFTTAVVVGKDLVPRLSQVTMEEFRNNMIRALAETRRSKTFVMQHCCCPHRHESAYFYDTDALMSEETVRYSTIMLSGRTDPTKSCERLFPPANIIHLVPLKGVKGTTGWYPIRMAIEELQEILVTPLMVADHMPDKVARAMTTAVTFGKQSLGNELTGMAISEDE